MKTLTEETPKPLLQIAGKSFLGHLLSHLQRWEKLEEVHIVVNSHDADTFHEWSDAWRLRLANHDVKLRLHNDGVENPDEQLGAMGDVRFLLDRVDTVADGILVAAGDSLYRFSLAPLLNSFSGSVNRVPALYESQKEELRQRSVLKMEGRQVQRVLECPEEPPSTRTCPSFYLYTSDAIEKVESYLDAGGNPDSLGLFADYIARTKRMEAVCLPEVTNLRLHCNTPSDLRESRACLSEESTVLVGVEKVSACCGSD